MHRTEKAEVGPRPDISVPVADDAHVADLQRRIEEEIETATTEAGLFPVLASSVVQTPIGDLLTLATPSLEVTIEEARFRELMDSEARARVPVTEWPDELRGLWQVGFVWLRDEVSQIPDSARINSARTIFRRSTCGEYCVFNGQSILIHETTIGSHNSIAGPVLLLRANVEDHCRFANMVLLDRARSRSFVRMEMAVSIGPHSAVGSHCGLLGGGYHVEKMPLRPGSIKNGKGVRIGPDNWIGQSVSILGGSRTGRGVIVATGVNLYGQHFEQAFVMGNPPRAWPVDINVRGLDNQQARDAGRNQGWAAALLPIYGPVRVIRTAPATVVVEYPEHFALGKGESTALLYFHAGALEVFFQRAIPASVVSVDFDLQRGARFEANFASDLEAHEMITSDLVVQSLSPGPLASSNERLEKEIPEIAVLLSALEVPQRVENLTWSSEDHSLEQALLCLSEAGRLRPRVIRPLSYDHLPLDHDLLLGLVAALRKPPSAAGESPANTSARHLGRNGPENQVSTGRFKGDVRVAQKLAEMLGREVDDPDAPFYSLGLDSLATATLSMWLTDELGTGSIDVFTHNTLRRLSDAIASQSQFKPGE